MKNIALILVAAAALIARAPLAAQQGQPDNRLPQIVQELFLAETVYPQEKGNIQLTAFARTEPGASARFLGEYGITDRLQVSVVTPAVGDAESDDDAWEPSVLYGILTNDAPVAVSVQLQASLAHGQAPQWEPSLIAARHFGPVQLHGSVSTGLSDPARDVSGTLAALFDAGRLTPTLEGVWAGSENDYVVPGLFVHFTEHMEAAVGVPLCIQCGSGPDHEVRAMFTVEF